MFRSCFTRGIADLISLVGGGWTVGGHTRADCTCVLSSFSGSGCWLPEIHPKSLLRTLAGERHTRKTGRAGDAFCVQYETNQWIKDFTCQLTLSHEVACLQTNNQPWESSSLRRRLSKAAARAFNCLGWNSNSSFTRCWAFGELLNFCKPQFLQIWIRDNNSSSCTKLCSD